VDEDREKGDEALRGARGCFTASLLSIAMLILIVFVVWLVIR
jgi:hypothetical protein